MYSILYIDLDILFLQYKFEATKLGNYCRLLDMAKICKNMFYISNHFIFLLHIYNKIKINRIHVYFEFNFFVT